MCDCTSPCSCDEGVSLTSFTDGADAPTITGIEVNPDNTITITMSDGSTYTTTNSIVVNATDPAILLYSITAPAIVTGNSSSFVEVDSYTVDTDNYFTQNGDVLGFEMNLYHDQRILTTANAEFAPEIRVRVGGQNISTGIGFLNNPDNYFLFPELVQNGRGMYLKGEITRRTNTTVYVTFQGITYGIPEDMQGGSPTQDGGIFLNNNIIKFQYSGHIELTVADLTSNDLVVDVYTNHDHPSGGTVTTTMEAFNIKHFKLIT